MLLLLADIKFIPLFQRLSVFLNINFSRNNFCFLFGYILEIQVFFLGWVMVTNLLLVGVEASYYYLEYLPASPKKQATVEPEQPGERGITVKEPRILTQNKSSQETRRPREGSSKTGDKAAHGADPGSAAIQHPVFPRNHPLCIH